MVEEVGRRERKKRRTRSHIRDAALELFAERGYRDTTIAAIAERADVATRAVTLHFPAKDDLLFADDPFPVATLRERLRARAPGEDTLDVVHAWTWDVLHGLDRADGTDDPGWGAAQRVLRARLLMDDDDLRGRARAGYREMEQVVAEGVGADLGLPADAQVPLLTATSLVAGLREMSVTREGRDLTGTAAGGLVDRVVAFARAGLVALSRPGAAP